MNRLLISVIIIALIFPMLTSNVFAIAQMAGAPTADPQANYTPNLANKYYSTYSDGNLCQMFKPSKQVIANYVDVRATGSDNTGVSLKLYDNDEAYLPSNVINTYYPPSSYNDGRNTMTRFNADMPIAVTPGNYYWLCLTSDVADVYWYADSPDGGHPSGTYDNGLLMHGTFKMAAEDFGFIIYSSNYEALPQPDPDPDPQPPQNPVDNNQNPNENLPAGVTAGTGAAPTEASTSIEKPVWLAVIDDEEDNGGSLRLYWEASPTADISGYKVFRSTDEDEGYTEIAVTEKTILTYTDSQAITGQKYYYFVRAYKDALESESTNKVNGISIDNTANTVSYNANAAKGSIVQDNSLIIAIGILIVVVVLLALGGGLYWFKFRKKNVVPSSL